MKSKISPTAIGVFIAGAIVILFGSVLLFGSGKIFKKTKTYLLTFNEPVTGLAVGAPVKLMGVNIGTVSRIKAAMGDTTGSLRINVLIEVDRALVSDAFSDHALHMDDREWFNEAVQKQGLRGRLDILSLLSGQLYVALDMYPDQPGFQLGRESEHGFWEIPTLPSTKREMMESLVTSLQNVSELDMQGMSSELKGLMAELRTDLSRLNIGQINSNLVAFLNQTTALLNNPELTSVITNLNRTLGQLDELAGHLNDQVDPLLANVDTDLKKAELLLDEGIQTLRTLRTQVEPGGALSRELIRTLDETGTTLIALRQLVEQIERNPSSLITGKKESTP